MKRLGSVFLLLSIFLVFSWIAVSAASQIEAPSAAVPTPPSFLRSWGAEGDMIRNPAAIAITAGPTIFVSNTSLNRITRIAPDQSFLNWGEFGKETGQFFWPGGIAADVQENTYVVDADTPGRIQKFDRDGEYISTWDKGVDGAVLRHVQDLDVAPNGDVYVSETETNRILVYNAAGELINYWGGKGAGKGKFSTPYGVAVDVDGGYVYVVDSGNARVQKFDNTGRFIRTWGEVGEGKGQFKKAWRIAVDSQNNVYVTDVETRYVQIFDSFGNFLARWGGPKMFLLPRGIEIDRSPKGVDKAGNMLYRDDVYIADPGQIRRFPGAEYIDPLIDPEKEPDLNSVKYWGQDPAVFLHAARGLYAAGDGRVYTTDRGPTGEEVDLIDEADVGGGVSVYDRMGVLLEKWPASGDERLKRPDGISGDSAGDLYVADTGTHRIVKYDRHGQKLTSWGKEGTAAGEFSYPLDITVNARDHVFVADTLNHRVQKFDRQGNYLQQWATPGKDPDELRGPTSVATDDKFVYVFNLGSMTVQKFDLAGKLVKEWGGTGSKNGEFGAIKKFTKGDEESNRIALIHEAPRLAVHGDFLLVADPTNHRIQVFDKEGTYLTQWGESGSEAGEFTRELDVAVANGEIYVADMAAHRLQVFSFERPAAAGRVFNGSFEDQPELDGWYHSSGWGRTLPSTREEAGKVGKYALLLGEEVETTAEGYGNKNAWAHQTIFVGDEIERPMLSFDYNIWVNDYVDWVDFLVVIEDAVGVKRLATVVQDGFRSCDGLDRLATNPKQSLGWRSVQYDLSQYRNQTIRLAFYNRYLHPESRGIWTYVNGVQIKSGPDLPPIPQGSTMFLPHITVESCDRVK